MRALVISPNLDLKIRKALRREARRIALRLLLRQSHFEVRYLLFKLRCESLRVFSRFLSGASKFAFRRHD
jgi:hypothetical protein